MLTIDTRRIGATSPETSLTLRVHGDPDDARQALLQHLAKVAPALGAIRTLRTMAGMEAYVMGVAFWVTLFLGSLALVLTMSGLFSVLCTWSRGARRKSACAWRWARRDVTWSGWCWQSLRPVGIGLLAGAGLAAAVASVLMSTPAASQVGELVRVFDPCAYVAGPVVIVTACVLAASIPATARRAHRSHHHAQARVSGLCRGRVLHPLRYTRRTPMRLAAGSTLGPYEITGALGAGGMGEVYRARDTRLGREVAVKVLPHDVAQDAERLARFEREARSASALNHPGIVTIHDFALREGEAYLVMELIRGESLRNLLARGPLAPRRLFAIATGVAEALAAAHAAGIVHRDLKPENVMVTAEGAPKILDFGLVKGGDIDVDLAQSPTELQVSHAGAVFGTLRYMSPEQARGEAIDYRSDQFALGLMLYEMAAGRHPFDRATPLETVAAILHDDAEPLGGTLPEPFVWVVERCLAKDPPGRYGSTGDLARDLARLRDRAASGTFRAQPPGRPEARTWWLIAPAVVVLLGLLTFAVMTWRQAPAGITDPVQVSVATPEIAEVHAGEVAQSVFLSPDGRHVVLYGQDAHGAYNLWLHDLRAGATRLLAANAFAAAWSPDSRAVAYFADGKLKVVSLDGGPPRIVCDARPEGTPSWHGETILFSQYSLNRGIYRVTAAGGTPELVVQAESAPDMRIPWWPEFLPDGKRFLYLVLTQPRGDQREVMQELRVGSLDGSAPHSLGAISSRAVFADDHLLFVRDGTLLARPFDPRNVRFTGDAKPLVDDIHYFRNTGLATFSASRNGLLAWRSSRRLSRLTWRDRTGTETGSIADLRAHAGVRLSPDGKRYAIGLVDPQQGTSDIWVGDLARESQERLTFRLLDETNPVWAPDGSIYYRTDGGGGPPDIFRLTRGQEVPEVVHRGPGVNEPHDISRDGRWLLFIDYTPPVGADIKALPLAPPGPPRAIAATPFQELSPRFSPDGRWVAYSSDVSGRPEVYVRAFEGSEVVRISQHGGTLPRWSRNGKELFFLAPAGRLMAVPVSNGFGVPRVLFQQAEAVDYDVDGDGLRFLVQLVERSSRPTVQVLVNWRARLEAAQ